MARGGSKACMTFWRHFNSVEYPVLLDGKNNYPASLQQIVFVFKWPTCSAWNLTKKKLRSSSRVCLLHCLAIYHSYVLHCRYIAKERVGVISFIDTPYWPSIHNRTIKHCIFLQVTPQNDLINPQLLSSPPSPPSLSCICSKNIHVDCIYYRIDWHIVTLINVMTDQMHRRLIKWVHGHCSIACLFTTLLGTNWAIVLHSIPSVTTIMVTVYK